MYRTRFDPPLTLLPAQYAKQLEWISHTHHSHRHPPLAQALKHIVSSPQIGNVNPSSKTCKKEHMKTTFKWIIHKKTHEGFVTSIEVLELLSLDDALADSWSIDATSTQFRPRNLGKHHLRPTHATGMTKGNMAWPLCKERLVTRWLFWDERWLLKTCLVDPCVVLEGGVQTTKAKTFKNKNSSFKFQAGNVVTTWGCKTRC